MRRPPLLLLLLLGLAAAATGACSLAISLDGLAGPALVDADGRAPVGDGGSDADDGDARRDTGAPPSSAYRAAVLADAPLAYYRLDLGAGDVVADEIGVHDGHVTGALTLAPGALAGDDSRAAVFDGASYVVVGDVLPFEGVASYSIEAWARPLAATSDPMCMVAKNIPDDAGALQDGYSFFLRNDTNRLTGNRYRSGVDENATGPGIAPDAFAHLVVTYDGATIRLYVDGEKIAEKASTMALARVAKPLTLGASRGGVYCFFRGALDEIAIYGKALAEDRIRAHHAVGVGR